MHALTNGPSTAERKLILAHGAGAPMDSEFMEVFAAGIASDDIRVVRFEFPYMAGRREGKKRGPDRMPILLSSYREIIAQEGGAARVVVGGKSMGGRVASMLAEESSVRGLLCLSYPFHPPKKPDDLRVDHLRKLTIPTLIVQGTRDPLGSREEVEGYGLSLDTRWLEDGDHDLSPRKKSGRTRDENWADAISVSREFILSLP